MSGQLYPVEPAHSSQLIRVSRSFRDDEDVIIKKKVKQSRYRPGVAQRVPGS